MTAEQTARRHPDTIPTRINPLQLRAVMGRDTWHAPHPHGPSGWRMLARGEQIQLPVLGQRPEDWSTVEGPPPGSIIVTQAPVDDHDLTEWIHASMSWGDRVPTYDELMRLKRAVWGDTGEAYQVHPPADRHVNIHEHCLHLWGRADGRRVLPDFGKHGTI